MITIIIGVAVCKSGLSSLQTIVVVMGGREKRIVHLHGSNGSGIRSLLIVMMLLMLMMIVVHNAV